MRITLTTNITKDVVLKMLKISCESVRKTLKTPEFLNPNTILNRTTTI